ncbi:DUF4913 domain-containing protein [Micromonospora sp.]|uniref:DUF4913 domain-containing protein n=1 Tax=Micromonospora sp. TaxID=1876 RepID=UPI003B3A98F9
MTAAGEWGSIFDPTDLVPPPSTAQDRQDTAWATSSSDDKADPPALLFATATAWVEGWLIPTYRRKISDSGSGGTWCPAWWRHPEVLVRMSALWRGFEAARLEPGAAMSAWLRDHLDHHLPLILAEKGPLEGCSIETGHRGDRLEPLPVHSPPPELAAFL